LHFKPIANRSKEQYYAVHSRNIGKVHAWNTKRDLPGFRDSATACSLLRLLNHAVKPVIRHRFSDKKKACARRQGKAVQTRQQKSKAYTLLWLWSKFLGESFSRTFPPGLSVHAPIT
jgi:hypothetical protein